VRVAPEDGDARYRKAWHRVELAGTPSPLSHEVLSLSLGLYEVLGTTFGDDATRDALSLGVPSCRKVEEESVEVCPAFTWVATW